MNFFDKFYRWFFLQEGRTPEGMFSFAHIFSVTLCLTIFCLAAFFLGRKYKNNSKAQFIILLISGIAIDLVFFFKMAYLMWDASDPWKTLIGNAPLYLCDMQIFIIPLAALTRGRFRDWCMDFVAIWGLLMGFFGTYFAGNIYYGNCAICVWSAISMLNHCISAFAALFIFVCKLNKMRKKDIPFTVCILLVFMTAALVIDYVDNHNFMFFFYGDGAPFVFFDNLVHNIKWLYQLEIYIMQTGYMVGFYAVYYLIQKWNNKAKAKAEVEFYFPEDVNKKDTKLAWLAFGLFAAGFTIQMVGTIIAIPNGTLVGLILKIASAALGVAAIVVLIIKYYKCVIRLRESHSEPEEEVAPAQ